MTKIDILKKNIANVDAWTVKTFEQCPSSQDLTIIQIYSITITVDNYYTKHMPLLAALKTDSMSLAPWASEAAGSGYALEC